jgi:hypothetical protein
MPAKPMPAEPLPAEPIRAEPMGDEARSAPQADRPFQPETAAVAEQIGLTALALAREANGAGLTTLGFLLESAALEAGAEAAARRWPADAAKN